MKSKKIIEREKKIAASHKKNDDLADPEKGGDQHVENKLKKENTEKIDLLANQVSLIKQITRGIGDQMKEEKGLLGSLDSSFVSTKN